MENKVAAFLLLCLIEDTKDDERSDTVQTSHFSSRLNSFQRAVCHQL